MSTMTFINLPVRDVPRTIEFFGALGFSFNEQFADENTACMVISEASFVMLHAELTFRRYTQQDVTDTSTDREVILGLSADSREEVDERVDKAIAAGGQSFGEPQDDGFMYMRAFHDLDGHQWSFIHMDMSAMPAG